MEFYGTLIYFRYILIDKINLIPNQDYKRTSIQNQYGEDRQGGISLSAKFPNMSQF